MTTITFVLLALLSDVGQPEQMEFAVEGEHRTALVCVPSAPNEASGKPVPTSAPAASRPMVFVFHGHGGTARYAARKFAIHKQWPQALVVYMQGLPTDGINGRGPGWQKRVGEDSDRDLKFFDAVLKWATTEQGVEPKRVYVAGHSNGAMMTYLLWAERHDKLAAVAPASGVFGRAARDAKPLPALIIAGRGDAIVPFKAQEWSLDNARRINRCDGVEGHDWAQECARYEPRAHGAPLVAYIHDRAHQLPSDAGKLMVQFFKEIDAGHKSDVKEK